MRRAGAATWIAGLWCFLALLLPVRAHADESPVLPARAYLLMDGTTGQVLHEYQGYTELPIASTTKIMTAILALEQGKPTDVVTVGQKPYDTGGSTIYLDLGEQQTLSNLMLALMLESANDAAVAIAEHLAGSEERFAGWMNEKARALGATHTHFVNSHGLHDPNHYSTAYDLALIARYAMRNQAFRELVLVEEAEIPGFKANPPRKMFSRNRLLGYYEGANGVKNGYTEEALQTNVASARRGDTELIAVVLGAENRLWTSSMALLDFGFSNYRTEKVVEKGESLGKVMIGNREVPAAAADQLVLTLTQQAAEPQRHLVVNPNLTLPLEPGAVIGEVRALADGKVAGTVALLAAAAVPLAQGAPAGATGDIPPGTLAPIVVVVGVGILVARQLKRRSRRE